MSPWTGIFLKQLHSSEQTFNCTIQVCIFSLNKVCDVQLVKKETFARLNSFALCFACLPRQIKADKKGIPI